MTAAETWWKAHGACTYQVFIILISMVIVYVHLMNDYSQKDGMEFW